MKRIAVILMTLLLMCTCAIAETADYTGIWYLNYMYEGETVIEAASVGLEVTMDIKEDGSVTLTALGEVTEGTWTLTDSGIDILDGETVQAFTLEDGNLVMGEAGMGMTFGREQINNAYVPAAKRTDTTIEEFNGSWTADSVSMFGMNISYETIGALSVMEISDGSVIITDTMGEDAEPFITQYSGELADGVITITSEADANGDANTYSICLLEDGMLLLDQSTEEAGEILIFYSQNVD